MSMIAANSPSSLLTSRQIQQQLAHGLPVTNINGILHNSHSHPSFASFPTSAPARGQLHHHSPLVNSISDDLLMQDLRCSLASLDDDAGLLDTIDSMLLGTSGLGDVMSLDRLGNFGNIGHHSV